MMCLIISLCIEVAQVLIRADLHVLSCSYLIKYIKYIDIEISSCLLESSVEITAATVLLSMCSGIVLRPGVRVFGAHQNDRMVLNEMCRVVAFPASLPELSPK